MTTQQSRPALSASDLRFLRRVCDLMAERVAPEAVAKVRVGDLLRRRELQDLRAAAMN
jgi:hypothetical protein